MRKRRGFSGNAAPSGVRWLLKAMPWPCKFENILSGVDITVSDIPTERTDMGSHRQRFLHDLPTVVALLRGETRVHSDHLMTSSLSLLILQSPHNHEKFYHKDRINEWRPMSWEVANLWFILSNIDSSLHEI